MDLDKSNIRKGSSVPLAEQLKTVFLEKIQLGEWESGQMLKTEREFCQEYGVSRDTLRQSLAQLEQMGLIVRIRGKGTFVARQVLPGSRGGSLFARSGLDIAESNEVSGQVHPTIGVLVWFYNVTEGRILTGVQQATQKAGYQMSVSTSRLDPEEEARLLMEMSMRCEGLIVWSTAEEPSVSVIRQLVERRYPIILVEQRVPGLSEVSYVGPDDYGGTYMATQHLLKLGYRRIAWVRDHRAYLSATRDRFHGFQDALNEAGLEPAALHVLSPGTVSDIYGFEWTINPERYSEDWNRIKNLLTSSNRPDAIVCCNDITALAVYHVARNAGVKIGQEVGLTGFDNLPLTSVLEVPLTTIAQPAEEVGNNAAEMLFGMLEKRISGVQRVVLPTELIVRQSCGEVRKRRLA